MTAPDPYVTAAEVRAAVTGLSEQTTDDPPVYVITDATIERFVARFEALVEPFRGTPYRVRTFTEDIRVLASSQSLTITWPHVTSIVSIAYAVGSAPPVTTDCYADGRRIYLKSGCWPVGELVTITYQAGHASPPAAIIDACYEYVRAEAIQQAGSTPRNVTGQRTDLGWIPAAKLDPTGWDRVDKALAEVDDERPVLVA